MKESEQAPIPYAATFIDNAAHNEWKCHGLSVIGNRTENQH